MKKLKFYYLYFYYKIYNSIEYTSKLLGGAFLSEMKAGIVLIALEFWLVLSTYNYYTVITNNNLHLSINKPIVFIPIFIIVSLKIYFFTDTKKWKIYKKEFDNLSSNYNKKGTIIVTIISLLIIANLIFSFYLLSRR
ncbi:hypothetical protein NAT51_00530 [Flavobacterium amniphilum]|uniref:hypothetical protein n=1 Tax=Flavobacterium amniphilum TaxID=1834035 RepID=UPI002029BDE8|nr:hypothetical protein [Flavobacterium amniphilum]MCL9803988.1 hypothetical protein [Flavobacterium amniphilum]